MPNELRSLYNKTSKMEPKGNNKSMTNLCKHRCQQMIEKDETEKVWVGRCKQNIVFLINVEVHEVRERSEQFVNK